MSSNVHLFERHFKGQNAIHMPLKLQHSLEKFYMCGLTHLEDSKRMPVLSELLHNLFGFLLHNNPPNEKEEIRLWGSSVKQHIILSGSQKREDFFSETVYTS